MNSQYIVSRTHRAVVDRPETLVAVFMRPNGQVDAVFEEQLFHTVLARAVDGDAGAELEK